MLIHFTSAVVCFMSFASLSCCSCSISFFKDVIYIAKEKKLLYFTIIVLFIINVNPVLFTRNKPERWDSSRGYDLTCSMSPCPLP